MRKLILYSFSSLVLFLLGHVAGLDRTYSCEELSDTLLSTEVAYDRCVEILDELRKKK